MTLPGAPFAHEILEGRVVRVRAGAWDSEGTLELGGDM